MQRHIKIAYISFLLALSCLPLTLSAQTTSTPTQDEGWTTSGTLAYSYQYAKTYLGHKLRLKGWVCKMGFTCGTSRNVELSIWECNGKKLQVMIWRIDSGHTGYSWGEYTEDK